jgi:hypothetical protein
MTALSPGRFGPLTDDVLVSRGVWQYAHYYDPLGGAPEMSTAAMAPDRPAWREENHDGATSWWS